MIEDPLDIPPFLRRQETPKSAPGPRPASQREWIMPPIALGDVARAVRTGCNTMHKIRKCTRGHYSDRDIREALHALIRSGDINRDGSRYASSRRHEP